MMRFQRMAVSFVLILNILGFGLMFLVLANGADAGELVYLAGSDVNFAIVIAICGVVANIGLGFLLVRISVTRGRRQDPIPQPHRKSFTGE